MFEEVLDAAVVAGIAVGGVDLLHTFTDHAALLDRRRVVRQIEHRRIIIDVTNLHPVQRQFTDSMIMMNFSSQSHKQLSNIT